MTPNDCFICGKHAEGDAAEGGVIYKDDLVYAGHLHTMGAPSAYRGWLVVETKRHVAGLGDLTDEEARAVGSLVNHVARVQRQVADAEHVYSFVHGDAVPHLHVHLAPRYAGTPQAYRGHRLRDWPDAPRVDEAQMRLLVATLRDALGITH